MDPVLPVSESTTPPEPKTSLSTYLWLGATSIGILAVLTVPVVLAFSPSLDFIGPIRPISLMSPKKSAVLSPIADEQPSPSNPTTPAAQSASTVYSPTQYIYLSQSFFSDGQALSQNREQSEEDKKVIIAKLQQAVDTVTEGIGKFPKRAELWAHRATIEWSITSAFPNALSNAIADMEEAAKLNPQNPDYTKALSDLYLTHCKINQQECRLDRAVYYLSRTQEQKPNDPTILYSLAQLQTKAGLLKNAQISFVKLLPLITDPTQKQQIESEKTAVEKLLAQAKEEVSRVKYQVSENQKPDTLTPDTLTHPVPSGLELTPDHETMSRELVVAAPGNTTSPYEDTIGSSALSGTATIPAGQTTMTIENVHVTDAAPVYVTPTGATNATLSVTAKKAGSHFTVSLDSPQNTDTPFRWWILNN